jgi:hypothetical protein
MAAKTADDTPVTCPKCQSSQVVAGKRGWDVKSGMIGANELRINCMKCGHTFKPGGKAAKDGNSLTWVVLAIIAAVILGMMGVSF